MRADAVPAAGSGETAEAHTVSPVDSGADTVAASDVTLPAPDPSGAGDSHDAPTVVYAHRAAGGDLKGHRIGNFQIGAKIGGGGMGVVYLAQQDSPRRQVAIKVMRQGITSQKSRDRFRHEADLLARLTHPAVAQVYEAGMHLPPDAVGPEQAIAFFAMEHVRGAKSLTAYAAINHLTLRERVALFVEVCRGVQHGHEQGVIHRDLKPANILVNDSGQPKIIDYGVALCIDPTEASPRHTETGQIVGTIQYMSPEQLSGPSRKLDPRSDVYSLGVVLYELICRRLPYDVDGRSFVEATRVILGDPPVNPSEHIGSIDEDLETIILRALDKNRHTRFPTVLELIEQCEKYLRGEPLDIRPVSRLTKTWRWSVDAASRRWEWTMLAIIALVTVLVGTAVQQVIYRQTNLNELVFFQTLNLASRYAGGVPLGDVQMVSVTPSSDVAGLAESLGLGEASIERLYTMRPIYGKFLQRLAGLRERPAAVLLDSRFKDDRPEYDAPLVEGIRALTTPDPARSPSRVDVICALATCSLGEDGMPAVAKSLLLAGVKPVAATIAIPPEGVRWVNPKVDLVIKNPNRPPIPGLALRTFTSMQFPGSELLIDCAAARSVRVSSHEPGVAAVGGVGKTLCSQEIFVLPGARAHSEDMEYGIDPSAIAPVYEVLVPSNENLRAHDTDITAVFGMSDEQLGQRFGGKILVIGAREIPAETFEFGDGRTAAGMEIHAAAIASLMQGFQVSLSGWDMFLNLALVWSAMGAVIGVILGMALPSRPLWRWTALLSVALCVLVATWCAMRFADSYFNPVPSVLSLVIATELAAFLYRARLIRREHQPWRFA